jgi:hypothetical protein
MDNWGDYNQKNKQDNAFTAKTYYHGSGTQQQDSSYQRQSKP